MVLFGSKKELVNLQLLIVPNLHFYIPDLLKTSEFVLTVKNDLPEVET